MRKKSKREVCQQNTNVPIDRIVNALAVPNNMHTLPLRSIPEDRVSGCLHHTKERSRRVKLDRGRKRKKLMKLLQAKEVCTYVMECV